jgi:hypothetical protein
MSDEITHLFVSDKSLHVARGSDIWSFKDNGKEPNEWDKVHFSDKGTSEPFVEFFCGEMMELIDASTIYGENRQKLKKSIITILTDGLLPAFVQLAKIRSSVSIPVPELDRRQYYETCAGKLWLAYKGLLPKATLLMGFNLGFLFQDENVFEKGLADFAGKHSNLLMNVPQFLKNQRSGWQQALYKFRNFIEHRSEEADKFERHYKPESAEMLFEAVWRTMAELLPVFIESRFATNYSIRPITEAERDPKRPRRFARFVCESVERSSPTLST